MNPMAGWLVGDSLRATPNLKRPPTSLGRLEEAIGKPPSISGFRWLSVPVLKHNSQELTLASGSLSGLAPGQIAVFGRTCLGRVSQVEENRATLQLWTASGERTGVLLPSKRAPLKSVCFGRGKKEPLVRFVESRDDPLRDLPVLWRSKANDPPSLMEPGLELGILRRKGNPERGEGHWVVEPTRPAGAEGRVFVAVGALPAQLPPTPAHETSTLEPSLVLDAVLGPQVGSVLTSADPNPVAVLTSGRVVGPVVGKSGGIAWVLRRSVNSWGKDSVAFDPIRHVLRPGQDAEPEDRLFSRGSEQFPRGLFLGQPDQASLPLAGKLEGVSMPTHLEEPE
ncbi:MAG: hypothetical protein QGH51_03760 [Planctomycetota bacterium]|nr:hypothetical protein [Planctomycetota bacterium]